MKTNTYFEQYSDEISNNEELSNLIDELIAEAISDDFKPVIPDSFANNVCTEIEKKVRIRESIERQMYILLTAIGIPAIAIFILYYFNVDFIYEYISMIFNHKIPIIFGVVCFVAIQVADIFTTQTEHVK